MDYLSAAPIDAGAELAAFEAAAPAGAGAVVSFTGRVRGEAGGARVSALHLQAHPRMTEAGIAKAIAQAQARWPLLGVRVLHRIGPVAPGGTLVFVAAASAHRRAAFEAADFLMDYLKTEAILWKKEVTEAGETWIEPREEDHRDAARWRPETGAEPHAWHQ